jgi:hypothetical protein
MSICALLQDLKLGREMCYRQIDVAKSDKAPVTLPGTPSQTLKVYSNGPRSYGHDALVILYKLFPTRQLWYRHLDGTWVDVSELSCGNENCCQPVRVRRIRCYKAPCVGNGYLFTALIPEGA